MHTSAECMLHSSHKKNAFVYILHIIQGYSSKYSTLAYTNTCKQLHFIISLLFWFFVRQHNANKGKQTFTSFVLEMNNEAKIKAPYKELRKLFHCYRLHSLKISTFFFVFACLKGNE